LPPVDEGSECPGYVVVIVVANGSIVLGGIVDPDSVVPGNVDTITFSLGTRVPDTVDVTPDRMIVSDVTMGGAVDGGMVDADNVVPENVVVYVTVIPPPSALAGIADPTPEAVY
jgi:hypothetical protein